MAAALIHRAIGDRLTPVFVDNGLLRLREADLVRDVFGRAFGMNLVFVDAGERFLTRLEGVADPEEKRRIVGDEFIRTFESQAALHGPFDFLAQGTLYPDVIESTAPDTKSAIKIKTHHNVGGLPADLRLPSSSRCAISSRTRFAPSAAPSGSPPRSSTANPSRVPVSPSASSAR